MNIHAATAETPFSHRDIVGVKVAALDWNAAIDLMQSRIAEASGHLERGEIAAKGEKIGKALAIIEGLMLGLDKERGGEIAENLERLYDYASRTLLKAHLENRPDLFKEVASLLREIKVGWDGIAPAKG